MCDSYQLGRAGGGQLPPPTTSGKSEWDHLAYSRELLVPIRAYLLSFNLSWGDGFIELQPKLITICVCLQETFRTLGAYLRRSKTKALHRGPNLRSVLQDLQSG